MDKFRDADCEKHYNEDFSCELESGMRFLDCKKSKIEIFKNIGSEKQELTHLGELKSDHSD